MPRPTCRVCDESVSRSAGTCPSCGAVDPAERHRTIDCRDCNGLGHVSAGRLGRTHGSISMSGKGKNCASCKGSGLIRVPY